MGDDSVFFFVFFFSGVVIAVFLSIEEMGSVLSLSHQWACGNLKLWRFKAYGINDLSMRFQFWSMYEASRVAILLRGSSVRVCLVVLNQGCCSCDTTYLVGCCDLMLTQPWIKVMYCSLLWLTLHIREGINILHLSTVGIVAHGRYCISHCFVLCVCFV